MGLTPLANVVSATAGADEGLTEDRSRNAEHTDLASDGQYFVKDEVFSSFDDGTFGGEYDSDND